MTACIYAIVPARRGRLRTRGVRGERLTVVARGQLAAIVGEIRRPLAPTPRNLTAYHATLQRLAEELPTVLPARFGTSVDGLDELSFILRARDRSLSRALREVRRRVQMTLRVVRQPGTRPSLLPPQTERSSGTAYLRSQATRAALASRVPEIETLRAVVRRWIRAERVEQRGSVATAYHLVPRGSARAYRRAIERAAATEGVRLVVSGPFPPYAFADDVFGAQQGGPSGP